MTKKKSKDINLLKAPHFAKASRGKEKSPSISRTITEALIHFIQNEKTLLVASIFGIITFIAVLFATLQLYQALQKQQELRQLRNNVTYKISFWQQVAKLHPDYRDAYFEIALLQYWVGKKEQALENVKKALMIDPNFMEGRALEKLLRN